LKSRAVFEFGNFQTPAGLADKVCRQLAARGIRPASVLEPTCGVGRFLVAAFDHFPSLTKAVGVEVNPQYAERARSCGAEKGLNGRLNILQGNLFDMDIRNLVQSLPEPLLILGNPPWVTNADLGSLGSSNLPAKTNFKAHGGLDAMTGKSNFDVSEWIMLRLLECMRGRDAVMAMLCKTAVARKVLLHAWTTDLPISHSAIYNIDAAAHFGAAVDASLLIVQSAESGDKQAEVFEDLANSSRPRLMGYHNGTLLADVDAHERLKYLQAREPLKWRSGIKHDCSKVMELTRIGERLVNGFGETADLEHSYVFPMLKSSDVASGNTRSISRWMIVPQRTVAEDTAKLEHDAPRTWAYLSAHREFLDKRASSIYRGRPPFSIFGVGGYSFSPWKICISGFYKKLAFTVVGPHCDQPVMLDDTCYFLPCESSEHARRLGEVLNSRKAAEFFGAFVFWDAKRPITSDLLGKLDIAALAREVLPEECIEWLTQSNFSRPSGRRPRKAKKVPTELQLWPGQASTPITIG